MEKTWLNMSVDDMSMMGRGMLPDVVMMSILGGGMREMGRVGGVAFVDIPVAPHGSRGRVVLLKSGKSSQL